MEIAHAGEIRPVTSFADIQSTLANSLAPINHAINEESPAGISVRLSQAALSDGAMSAEHLRTELDQHGLALLGLSAVSISGGAKDQVHTPDWRTEERLEFMFPATNLAAQFATPEREIGVTTNALGYRGRMDLDMPGNWAAMTLNIVRMVQHLATMHERSGVLLHIDLEPEPGSVLRDSADIVRFYSSWLLTRGSAMLSDRMQVTNGTAAETILRHVRIALDTAHAAVVWDDAAATLDAFADHGIRIGRFQVSSALAVEVPTDTTGQQGLVEHLQALQSPTLLQQVVAARDGEISQRFDDLGAAIEAIGASGGQTWRIHTHAPLLADRYGIYASTMSTTAEWLREISARNLDVGMIELRSANWDVVPHDDRGPLEAMILREAQWVRSHLG